MTKKNSSNAASRPSSSARSQARRYAMQALYEWQMSGSSPRDIEQQFLIEHASRNFDREYFHELLKQVTTLSEELDELISPCLDRAINEVDIVEKAILSLATYELKNRLDIPYRVVINEAIELAKTFGADQAHKFVNGTLDKLAAELRSIEVTAKRNS